ncbi:MAG: hypothetical protein N4A40_04645 [Tissierellales bacterium]|nr:hypothetical protein [Tissierellales bacterium]
MKTRWNAIVIMIIMLIGFYFYSENHRNFDAVENDKKNAIEIAVWELDYANWTDYERQMPYKFVMENGINVVINQIKASNLSEYQDKLRELLYKKEGPTLIYISKLESYKTYSDNGVAMNISGKVNNASELYPIMKNDYFIPVRAEQSPIAIKKEVIEGVGYSKEEPEFWSIRDKWLKSSCKDLNWQRYDEILGDVIENFDLINIEKRKIDLTKKEFISHLIEAKKELWSSLYLRPHNYSVNDYENLLLNPNSNLYQESTFRLLDDKNFNYRDVEFERTVNLLNPFLYYGISRYDDLIILDNQKATKYINLSGFIVNTNGKNTNSGLSYINGLIERNNQKILLEGGGRNIGYPTNMNAMSIYINTEGYKSRKKFEKKYLKRANDNILSGKYKVIDKNTQLYKALKFKIDREILRLVFEEKTIDKESMTEELRYLGNRLELMINE